MDIKAVYLHAETSTWVWDLVTRAADLAQLSNEVVSTHDYDSLVPEWRTWDSSFGNHSLSDPLRNALKVQKFGLIAGNGLLFSAAHAASNSLSEEPFHPYTPLSTGVLCRSAVEQLLYAKFLLDSTSHEDMTSRTFRIFVKGLNDYKWSRSNPLGRNSTIGLYKDWATSRSIPKRPSYDPAGLLADIIDFDEKPYSYLSDFVHGNPLTTALSIIDAREDFGTNRQHDYWCLAIAFTTSIAVLKLFATKYPHAMLDAHQKKIRHLYAFSKTFEMRAVQSWGLPKIIPDRDFA